jgi:hypothetical protein
MIDIDEPDLARQIQSQPRADGRVQEQQDHVCAPQRHVRSRGRVAVGALL